MNRIVEITTRLPAGESEKARVLDRLLESFATLAETRPYSPEVSGFAQALECAIMPEVVPFEAHWSTCLARQAEESHLLFSLTPDTRFGLTERGLQMLAEGGTAS